MWNVVRSYIDRYGYTSLNPEMLNVDLATAIARAAIMNQAVQELRNEPPMRQYLAHYYVKQASLC